MGCVGNKKQVRLDSTIFKFSGNFHNGTTVDASMINPNRCDQESMSPDYLLLKSNHFSVNSTMIDPAKVSIQTDAKINEHYKIIRPFFKKNPSESRESTFYIVQHIQTHALYLMKIKKKITVSPDNYFILNFDETFCSITHPNIIQYQGIFSDDNNFYVLSEYPTGYDTTLSEKLKQIKTLSESQIKTIVQQVLHAIFYLHNIGIINRNISLDNILINMNSESDINIKIFNLDQAIEDNSPVKKVANVYEKVGSLFYLSPEALRKQFSTKSDIWSLGVLMYYLIYGSFPFEGESVDEVYTKIRERRITTDELNEMNKEVSPTACELLAKMLSLSPEERLNTWECLHSPWFETEVIPQDKNGLGAIIKCAIVILIKNIYHREDFVSLKDLYSEIKQKNNGVFLSDVYTYLSEPINRRAKSGLNWNKDLTYPEFCDCLLTDDFLLSNSNLSYLFDYIDKDTDNILGLEDFKLLFEFNYFNIDEDDDIEYLLMSLEHKSLVFPDFKQLLYNYQKYLDYL
jgi:serine/threonine protein kinase